MRKNRMRNQQKLSVAIVGAGIGGLAVAAALRKFFIEPVVYEQADAFARVGAGIQQSPNAREGASLARHRGAHAGGRVRARRPRSTATRSPARSPTTIRSAARSRRVTARPT